MFDEEKPIHILEMLADQLAKAEISIQWFPEEGVTCLMLGSVTGMELVPEPLDVLPMAQ